MVEAAFLAILEAYFPVTDEGVFSHFRAVSEAIALPVVFYTNPNFRQPEVQRGLRTFNRVFAGYNLAACIKGGLRLRGDDVGNPLPPQEGIEEARRSLLPAGALKPKRA